MSGKMEQVLQIEPPHELTFEGPFNHAVNSSMILTNPTDKKVCFKIKTTAPKRYCVKPNSGVVEPFQHIQVSVSLQPFEFDPNEKNRHKFMVQSQFAPDHEFNADKLWKEMDSSQFMDSKLRCVFVMPNDEGDKINNEEHMHLSNIKQEYRSPSPKITGEKDPSLKIEEIKKLREEVSHLRQENIQLKEESLRQKRLVGSAASNPQSNVKPCNEVSSTGYNSAVVAASNPNADALANIYIYAAIFILILGIIIGKWVL